MIPLANKLIRTFFLPSACAVWLACGLFSPDAEALGAGTPQAAAFNSEGMARYEKGDFAEAADSFRRCLLEKPDFAEARFNLGASLYMSGDFAGAIRELNAVLKSDPGQSAAAEFAGRSYLKLAAARAENGDVAGAMKLCEEYPKQPYSTPEIRRSIGEIEASLKLSSIGRPRGQAVASSGTEGPQDANGGARADARAEKSAGKSELNALLEIVRKFPQNSEAHARLRAILRDGLEKYSVSKRESDEMFAVLNEIVERDMKNAEAHLTLGAAYRAYGQTDRAQYHFGMVRTADPSSIEAIEGISEIENYRARKADILKNFGQKAEGAAETAETAVAEAEPAGGESTAEDELAAGEEPGQDEESRLMTPTISGKVPREIISIRRRIEGDTAGTGDLKKAACYYISRREFKRALGLVEAAFSLDPSDNETNYLMAFVLNLMKKKKDAIPFVSGINPETIQDARLLNDAGVLLIKLSKRDQALRFFQRGIEADPAYIENYLSLAIYYSQINDFENARKYFREALEESKDNMKVLYFSALSSRREGRYEEFLETAARIQKIAPDGSYAKKIRRKMGLAPEDRLIGFESEKTLVDVAKNYIGSKDFDRARTKLTEALRINPDSRDACLAMAELERLAGRNVERLAYLLKVHGRSGGDQLALDIAREFFNLGFTGPAEEYFTVYSAKNPFDSMAKLEYAGYLKKAGLIMKARTVCEAVAGRARTPLESEAARNLLSELEAFGTAGEQPAEDDAAGNGNLMKLADALSELEMYREIENIVGRYVKNGAHGTQLYEIYSDALLKNKKYTAAIEALKKLVSFDRTNYRPYCMIGQVYMKRNNFARAEEYFRQALIFKPGDAEMLMNLGDACFYQKNFEDAEVSYSEGLAAARNVLVREELKIKLEKIKAHRGGAAR